MVEGLDRWQEALQVPDPGPGPLEQLIAKENREELAAGWRRLPAIQRRAIRLAKGIGGPPYTHRAGAERMGISQRSFCSLVSGGLGALRAELEGGAVVTPIRPGGWGEAAADGKEAA